MSGAPDRVYIRARSVLLDALEALRDQREAVVLVGAQAIYLHTGEADFAVAEFTDDADLGIDPRALQAEPRLDAAMSAASFMRHAAEPGIWVGRDGIQVDLIVPEALAGSGRRGARLGVHGNKAARRAVGLEAAMVDHTPTEIPALDPQDTRRIVGNVAGAAALLVAKLHKLGERQNDVRRLVDKDALDVFRILGARRPHELGPGLRASLADESAGPVTTKALEYLEQMFGRNGTGIRMVTRALHMEDPVVIAARCIALASELLESLREQSIV